MEISLQAGGLLKRLGHGQENGLNQGFSECPASEALFLPAFRRQMYSIAVCGKYGMYAV